MKVALVASPFIPVPPNVYGGTELFVANLAKGLQQRGIRVVVYCNGASTTDVEKKWLYSQSEWPVTNEVHANLKDANHAAWAVADARRDCDIIHLNSLPGLVHCRSLSEPVFYTVHHPHEPQLSAFYAHHPGVHYVTISEFQRRREKMPNMRTIHHGIDMNCYHVGQRRGEYLAFLGRIAPIKGTHIAVEVAKRTGIPLKIAGEVQPIFRDYFASQIKPHIDGKLIDYVGEVDLRGKNELFAGSFATLFPVQWDEPFGLVMIESMACGTPVLALPGGSVTEVVRDGVSGMVCHSVEELASCAVSAHENFNRKTVRSYAFQNFSVEVMAAKYEAVYQGALGIADGRPTVSDSNETSGTTAVA